MSSECENSNGGGIGLPNDPSFTLDTTQAHSVAYAIQERAIHPNLNAGPGGKGFQEGVAYTLEARHHVQAVAATGDVFPTLRAEGFDASEDGTGRGAGAVAVAFTSKDYGADASEGLAPTMRSMGHNESHANGGGQLAVAFGVSESPDLGHCLRSGASKADKHEPTTYVQTGMQVRRLTPTECERLQGFPDGHTLIPWRGKGAVECPDGPRYKALGNSMCVAVMHWIGKRIHQQAEATP